MTKDKSRFNMKKIIVVLLPLMILFQIVAATDVNDIIAEVQDRYDDID